MEIRRMDALPFGDMFELARFKLINCGGGVALGRGPHNDSNQLIRLLVCQMSDIEDRVGVYYIRVWWNRVLIRCIALLQLQK